MLGIAFVACLLLKGGPAAIFRTVPKIVVDSIQTFGWRPVSHIFQERFKALPAITNRDATFYIPISVSEIPICAPFPHRHPCFVGGMTCISVTESVTVSFFRADTARPYISAGKVGGLNPEQLSAAAFAEPECSPAGRCWKGFPPFYDSEKLEGLAG
jgi:hypothetical protein